jgi:hypothetical protein
MSTHLRQLLLLILFLSTFSTSNGQGVRFVRKDKSFQVPNPHLIFHPIGVIAGKDTLVYVEDPSRAWTITLADARFLRVSRPIRWRDTLVNRRISRYPDNYQYWKDERINGEKMTRLNSLPYILGQWQRLHGLSAHSRLQHRVHHLGTKPLEAQVGEGG